MSALTKFDTADYEQHLTNAGVDPGHAKAHRIALVSAVGQSTDLLASKEDLTLLETRLEKAMALQTAKIADGQRIQTITLVTTMVGLFGLALALLKLS